MTAPDRLLKPEQVAERLQIGRTAAYDLIYSGDLESVDVRSPGSQRSRLRVPESAVLAFIKSRSRKAS